MDGWTSCANDSYLGFTCHFYEEVDSRMVLKVAVLDVRQVATDETAPNLKILIEDCLNEWNILHKVNHIVTDNTANMKLAVELLGKKNFPCFAHSLNLVVSNAFSKCDDCEFSAATSTHTELESEPKNPDEPRPRPCQEFISKCKSLVTFFKQSPLANRLLKEANCKVIEDDERFPIKLI